MITRQDIVVQKYVVIRFTETIVFSTKTLINQVTIIKIVYNIYHLCKVYTSARPFSKTIKFFTH